jgi:protein-S-isoprenylcysteine O-methyltransferase Ste14
VYPKSFGLQEMVRFAAHAVAYTAAMFSPARTAFMKLLPSRIWLAAALVLGFCATASADDVLFENVRIFNGKGAELSAPSNVLVQGNAIAQISTDPIEAEGAQHIAGNGRTLMPGLIDAHWHAMLIASTPVEAMGDVGFANLAAGDEATAALLYPAFVVVAPGWGYDGWLNWSTGLDLLLQGIGLGLWAVGMAVLVWAARVLGRYMSVEGVTVDHELVSSGPYRYVRHPVYGSFTAIAVGLSLVFRSYVLAGLAVVWVMATVWWVAAEEELLASPEGLGDAYLRYTERTGRFLPRLRRAQG